MKFGNSINSEILLCTSSKIKMNDFWKNQQKPIILLPEILFDLSRSKSHKNAKKSFDSGVIFSILLSLFTKSTTTMVLVVQLVRTPDCDSGGRGFEPLRAPHFL